MTRTAATKKRRAQQKLQPEQPETEDERWMRILPKPPRPISEQDEGSISIWMRRCLDAGGIEGLKWAWQPQNFPYGRYWRASLFHVYGQLNREENERSKRQARQQAEELGARGRNEAHEVKRRAGWAS